MIAYLSGTILDADGRTLTIENNGVGYTVFVPQHVLVQAGIGQTVEIWTSFIVREQSQELFGFLTKDERTMFEKVITVSGVGPKGALGIFDTLPLDRLIAVISNRDATALAQAPGIGKKTAEKIIVELSDKLDQFTTSESPYATSSDIQDALSGLGYSTAQIRLVVSEIDMDADIEGQIKQALQLLNQ